jgi:hypothetical protein
MSLKQTWHENHHLYEAYLWVALVIPAVIWWKESILFVILVSLYANYKTAISAHEGRKGRLESGSSELNRE